jgi:putative ABC transport system permease protein
MNGFATLAARNVGRNRRRSMLTATIFGFGFLSLTLAGGFMAQSFEGLREGTVRGGVGHLQLATPEYFSSASVESLGYGLPGAEEIALDAARDSEVVEVLRRIEFFGLVSTGEAAIPFVGSGLEPGPEARIMDAAELVSSGRWLLDDGAPEAVVGLGLARALGIEPGNVVTLMVVAVDGVLNAVDVEVVGVISLPVKEIDDRYLAASLATANEVLRANGMVSKLVLMIRDRDRAKEVGQRLTTRLGHGNLSFRTWQELGLFYRQVRYLYLGIFGFLGTVLIAIVLLAAANSMLMITVERTREIGTLRALGMRPGRILRLFVMEGGILGLAGCLGGGVCSVLLREVINRIGIELPPPPGVAHPVQLTVQIYPEAYLVAGIGMLLAALLASWLPALRAARRPIVESLAHV